MAETESRILICTVGGTPEAIVAALKYWRPQRVVFVHSPDTKGNIEAAIVPKARDQGVDLDAGRYDLFELADAEDLERCLAQLRQLTDDVKQWTNRGNEYQVVVDFTGGTKCMSAAVALLASRWPCLFSYVGGSERTKGGVGVVVSGNEKIVQRANPWDALGYQAIEHFISLFDERAFVAAANVARRAKENVSQPARKREFAVLEHLAKAFDAWDRFDHEASKDCLENVAKSANDLRGVLGQAKAGEVLDVVERSKSYLEALRQAGPPSSHHVVDLLANAKRRKDEGRLDDAVARLYRAIEAVAQVALKENHGIESTQKVPLDRVPQPLQADWASRANEGFVSLGLQDAYRLLNALEDPLGKTFEGAGLSGTKSPLVARNQSILAHGFERVGLSTFDKLWKAALSLAGVAEASLPTFPTLG